MRKSRFTNEQIIATLKEPFAPNLPTADQVALGSKILWDTFFETV